MIHDLLPYVDEAYNGSLRYYPKLALRPLRLLQR